MKCLPFEGEATFHDIFYCPVYSCTDDVKGVGLADEEIIFYTCVVCVGYASFCDYCNTIRIVRSQDAMKAYQIIVRMHASTRHITTVTVSIALISLVVVWVEDSHQAAEKSRVRAGRKIRHLLQSMR